MKIEFQNSIEFFVPCKGDKNSLNKSLEFEPKLKNSCLNIVLICRLLLQNCFFLKFVNHSSGL